jgi:adenylate cyclase
VEAEGRRLARNPRPDPAAIDDGTRGWAILNRLNTRENRGEARRLFERALTNDPNTVDALVGLAYVLQGYSNSPVGDRGQAEALLRRARDLEPNRATTYFVLGLLRESQGRMTESVDALQSAIALDRNYAYAHLRLGLGVLLSGRLEEAIVLAHRAMRLNPRDPNIADCFLVVGVAHLLLGRTDEAVENLQRASAANPSLWSVRLSLAAALGYAQRTDDAKKEFAEHLRLRPEFNSLATIRAAMPSFGTLSDLPHAEQTLLLGLRRAGLPDS